jgi:hypothetical protein
MWTHSFLDVEKMLARACVTKLSALRRSEQSHRNESTRRRHALAHHKRERITWAERVGSFGRGTAT